MGRTVSSDQPVRATALPLSMSWRGLRRGFSAAMFVGLGVVLSGSHPVPPELPRILANADASSIIRSSSYSGWVPTRPPRT